MYIHTLSLHVYVCIYTIIYWEKEYITKLFLYSFFLFNKTVQFYQNIRKLTSILFERCLSQNQTKPNKKQNESSCACFLFPFHITHMLNNPGPPCSEALSPTPLRYNNNLKKDLDKLGVAVSG